MITRVKLLQAEGTMQVQFTMSGGGEILWKQNDLGAEVN